MKHDLIPVPITKVKDQPVMEVRDTESPEQRSKEARLRLDAFRMGSVMAKTKGWHKPESA